jgi:hypothetical protein
MNGVSLRREVLILVHGEPIIYKKEDMNNVKKFIEKKIKKYKYDFLFSFTEFEITNELVSSNDNNIDLSYYTLTNKNNILVFISNLKNFLKNKDFKFIKENLLKDFY